MLNKNAALLSAFSLACLMGCSEPVQATGVAPESGPAATEASALQSEGPYDQTCSYSDITQPAEDAADEVLCTMRYVSTDTGLRYTFRFGGRTVVLDSSGETTNGLWRAAKIDGRPAVSRELWRGSYVAATADLRVTFEWRDRNSPQFPAN